MLSQINRDCWCSVSAVSHGCGLRQRTSLRQSEREEVLEREARRLWAPLLGLGFVPDCDKAMATAQQSGSTRQLVIKTGVVNRSVLNSHRFLVVVQGSLTKISCLWCRLVKELQAYKDEAAMLEQRVQAMQDSNEDEYEIKQQVSSPKICENCTKETRLLHRTPRLTQRFALPSSHAAPCSQ